MTTSLKGIFKYFTQIFDEKEQEMQIGHPTDVKHVAHIGWDGSSSSDPTWMNDFKSGPGLSTEALISNGQLKTSAKDFYLGEASKPAATVKEPLPENSKEKPKQKSRRRSSADGAADLDSSSNRGSSEGSTRSGRHRSKTSMDSPIRSQKSNQGIESPCDDRAGIPKPSRRKKSKGTSSGEGSSRSSRSKARNHSDDDLANNERCLSSVVEGNEEVKG